MLHWQLDEIRFKIFLVTKKFFMVLVLVNYNNPDSAMILSLTGAYLKNNFSNMI